MARITEATLDDEQRRRLHAPAARRPSLPTVVLAPVAPLVSLVALVGGAGALVAGPLPLPIELVAIGAVAVGGYLAGVGRVGAGTDAERAVLHRERGEVIRAALGLGLRGNDALAELARGRSAPAPGPEPSPDGVDDREARRAAVLRPFAVRPDPDEESLDPAADEG